APTLVTIAKRPSCGHGMRGQNHAFPKNGRGIFSSWVLETLERFERARKISFSAPAYDDPEHFDRASHRRARRRNFTKLDSSGKSPAQRHHHKNRKARAAYGRGLFLFLTARQTQYGEGRQSAPFPSLARPNRRRDGRSSTGVDYFIPSTHMTERIPACSTA